MRSRAAQTGRQLGRDRRARKESDQKSRITALSTGAPRHGVCSTASALHHLPLLSGLVQYVVKSCMLK
jgi:hypothetical protein